jgi:hypothetical protein
VCIGMAVAGGSAGLDAAVVLGEASEVAAPDEAALRDFAGDGVVVHLADMQGNIRQ